MWHEVTFSANSENHWFCTFGKHPLGSIFWIYKKELHLQIATTKIYVPSNSHNFWVANGGELVLSIQNPQTLEKGKDVPTKLTHVTVLDFFAHRKKIQVSTQVHTLFFPWPFLKKKNKNKNKNKNENEKCTASSRRPLLLGLSVVSRLRRSAWPIKPSVTLSGTPYNSDLHGVIHRRDGLHRIVVHIAEHSGILHPQVASPSFPWLSTVNGEHCTHIQWPFL